MAERQAQNSTGPSLLFNSKPFKKLKPSDCYFETTKEKEGKTEKKCHVMWNSLLNTGWKVDTKLDNPTLLVNCMGDIQNANQLQEVYQPLKSIIRHLFKNSENTWIFTEAYANSFSETIGDAIKDIENTFNTVDNEEVNVKITNFGFATWESILLKDHVQDTNYQEQVRNAKKRRDKSLPLGDSNTQYILMKAEDPVDENNGNNKFYRTADLRYDLLRYCQSPKINLVLGGSTRTLERLANCLKAGIPCWLIENTGGLTDFLIPMIRSLQECDKKHEKTNVENLMEIINQISALSAKNIAAETPNLIERDDMEEVEDLQNTIRVSSLIQTSKSVKKFDKDLLKTCLESFRLVAICNVSDFEGLKSKENFLKVFVRKQEDRSKNKKAETRRQYQKYVKKVFDLLLEWNCSELVRNVLNSHKQNRLNFLLFLHKSLQANNVEFIKILFELEPTIMFFIREDSEIDHHPQLKGKGFFGSLYSSDNVKLRLVERFCEKEISSSSSLSGLAQMVKSFICSDETSKCDLSSQERATTDSSFHMFLWCIFMGNYDIAKFLWGMTKHPIANALIAVRVLRAFKQLEGKMREKYERENQAVWYEQMANDLILECNDRDPIRTKFILLQKMKHRGNVSFLELAIKDEPNDSFLANEVCEQHLDAVWTTCRENNWKTILWMGSTSLFFSLSIASIIILLFNLAGLIEKEAGDYVDLLVTCSVFFLAPIICTLAVCIISSFQKNMGRKTIMENHDIRDMSALTPNDDKRNKNLIKQIEANTEFDEINVKRFLQIGINLMSLKPLGADKSFTMHLIGIFFLTPFNKFVMHSLSFTFFILLFTYVILTADVDFSKRCPSLTEGMLILYLLALFLQELNEFLASDYKDDPIQSADKDTKISKFRSIMHWFNIKGQSYFQSWWNVFDMALLVFFIVLMSFRLRLYQASINSSDTDHFTDTVWILSFYYLYFFLWCIRFFQVFQVSQILGPKLIMIKLMLTDLMQILVYISIVAFAYSVWMKALLRQTSTSFSQNDTSKDQEMAVDYLSSSSINQVNITLFFDDLLTKPLWHLFGESLSADFEDFPKLEEDPHYTYKLAIIKFWGPMLRFMYMLITVVLLLNLMIAIFNKSIAEVDVQAKKLWNVYRKSIIIEYYAKPVLPMPFSIFQNLTGMFRSKAFKEKFRPTKGSHFKCTVLSIKDESEEASKWIEFTSDWEKNIQYKFILKN